MTDLDKEGDAIFEWLLTSIILILIISVVVALGGCASMPGPLPTAQGYAALPNCVVWCTVSVHAGRAESDIESDGTGTVTGGDQALTGTSQISNTKSRSGDP